MAQLLVQCFQEGILLQIFSVRWLIQTVTSLLLEADPLRSTFHILRYITGSSFIEILPKEVFKSKAFFYSSFLPYMLPFFYPTVQILLKLYSLPGNKCFICNGLFNLHPYDFRCQCSHSAIEKTNTLRDFRPSK